MLAHGGLLRASALETGTPLALQGVTDDGVDPLLPAGAPLRAFVTALVRRAEPGRARERLAEAVGPAGAARAAAVAGNFEMMNRVVDATGCPVPPRVRELAEPLGLDLG